MTKFIKLEANLPFVNGFSDLLINLDDISTVRQLYVKDKKGEIRVGGCEITLKSKSEKIEVEEGIYKITKLIQQAPKITPYQTK